MTSFVETSAATFDTSMAFAQRTMEGKSTALARYSLTLANGMAITYADEIGFREQAKELITKFDALTPVLIACNDYCDIGLAAKRQRITNTNQFSFEPLLNLENDLRGNMETKIDRFKALIPDPNLHQIVDNYIRESIVLANHVPQLDPNGIKEFLEIDSALFESVCIGVSFPHILPEEGFSLYTPAETYEDLRMKYKFFTERNPQTKRHQKTLGLHALEMVMKIEDDQHDNGVDSVLRSPSFAMHAQFIYETTGVLPDHTFAQLKDEYSRLARDCGFASPVVEITRRLLNTTHALKSLIAHKQTTPITRENSRRVVQTAPQNTTLRERLLFSGFLDEITT